jgi:hypothetical protein
MVVYGGLRWCAVVCGAEWWCMVVYGGYENILLVGGEW